MNKTTTLAGLLTRITAAVFTASALTLVGPVEDLLTHAIENRRLRLRDASDRPGTGSSTRGTVTKRPK